MKNLDQKIEAGIVCGTCLIAPPICLCDLIPRINLKTKISLIIHRVEMNRSSNTGRLALHALENSDLHIRGIEGESLDLRSILDPNRESLLLYPSDDSFELTAEYVASLNKDVQLIVPDGNWRQARKVHTRHSELQHIPRVMVPRKQSDGEYLRQEHSEHGMSTMQAIAHAIGIIESVSARDTLLNLFSEKVKRTVEFNGYRQRGGTQENKL